MRTYMLNRYHARRGEAIERLGGKCIDCGTTDELEFDHKDSKTKAIDMARVWSYSRERFETELAKCVLRCKSCHITKSRQFDWRTVEHGGGVSGKRGCKCEPCLKRKAEYNRNYRQNNPRPSSTIGTAPSF